MKIKSVSYQLISTNPLSGSLRMKGKGIARHEKSNKNQYWVPLGNKLAILFYQAKRFL